MICILIKVLGWLLNTNTISKISECYGTSTGVYKDYSDYSKSGICLLIAPVPVHCFSITFLRVWILILIVLVAVHCLYLLCFYVVCLFVISVISHPRFRVGLLVLIVPLSAIPYLFVFYTSINL